MTEAQMADALSLSWNSHPAEVEDQLRFITPPIPMPRLLGPVTANFRVPELCRSAVAGRRPAASGGDLPDPDTPLAGWLAGR
jgi:hypothetical protein